jgi:N-glycosylase/DNA lyase
MRHTAVTKLLHHYEEVKDEIDKRLEEFKTFNIYDKDRLMEELCFCICTPQTRARSAYKAVTMLRSSGLLWRGGTAEIAAILRRVGVRFHNVKAHHIVVCRSLVDSLPSLIDGGNGRNIRQQLVKTIPGFGMKEASHFLRNIGFRDVAILDRHVLRWMRTLGILRNVPKRITNLDYLKLEEKFFNVSHRLGIPHYVLDLVIWSLETGEVFK